MNVNIDGISSMPNTYDYINNYAANPSALIIFSVIIIVYYVIFASLGSSGAEALQRLHLKVEELFLLKL